MKSPCLSRVSFFIFIRVYLDNQGRPLSKWPNYSLRTDIIMETCKSIHGICWRLPKSSRCQSFKDISSKNFRIHHNRWLLYFPFSAVDRNSNIFTCRSLSSNTIFYNTIKYGEIQYDSIQHDAARPIGIKFCFLCEIIHPLLKSTKVWYSYLLICSRSLALSICRELNIVRIENNPLCVECIAMTLFCLVLSNHIPHSY